MLLLALLFAAQADPALDMVDGIKRYLVRATESRPAPRHDRDRLKHDLGVVDPRVRPNLHRGTLLHENSDWRAFDARWQTLARVNAEGVVYEPKRVGSCAAVAIPDAGEQPEHLARAQRLAASGCLVLAPVLIDRDTTWSGNPKVRMTSQSHREFIYRMAFPLGRHIIGYEVQKVLAAVDWLAAEHPALPIEIHGRREGALIAVYAAAIDPRIKKVTVSEYPSPGIDLWKQPIDRNVWRGFKDFDESAIPKSDTTAEEPAPVRIAPRDPVERMRRQFEELIDFTQRLIAPAEIIRANRFSSEGAKLKDVLRDEVFGRLPSPSVPINARVTPLSGTATYDAHEVRFDIHRDLSGYGVILVPKGLKPAERRAAVVLQHGLNGRPQDLFGQPRNVRAFEVYRNYGETLVNAGYIVYVPQNPYIHDFRPIARLANPLGLSLYSVIFAQYERMLDWLVTLPYVDANRIGFYGLSYGGKTALRIPPLLDRFQIAVCAGDFNEWIRKLTSPDLPYSYMFTGEYEILEWNLAHVASHAEMAMLMAPRPFMVERGHRDGVGDDEWVSYEYAKVRRFYDEAGLGDRTKIAYFNGPHRIDGIEALAFLNRFLQPIRVGAAKVVITPPAGIPMAGYYSTRLMTGVHDDLHAKAIVISAGDQRVALVACDLVNIPPAVIEEARELIQAATGIPAANVMISATHSHTGPLVPGGGAREGAYGGNLPIARDYRNALPRKIAESVRLAAERLTPARASFGKGREETIGFNRRFFMKDGTVGWNPGKLNPNIVKPAGAIDAEVPVVYFESTSGEPIATYVNFALHLDTVGGLEASGDYPFTLASELSKAKGASMLTMFTIGAAGNINHIDVKSGSPQKGHGEAARIGGVLAREVLNTMQRLEPAPGASLRIARRTVLLDPARLEPGDEARAAAFAKQLDAGETVSFIDTVYTFKVLDTVARRGQPLEAEVQVIALGDRVAWVALPGEVFTELAAAIKRDSPFPLTIVTELAHGPVTYFPNDAAFPQGNYEVVTSRGARGSGEKLVEAARTLLRELKP